MIKSILIFLLIFFVPSMAFSEAAESLAGWKGGVSIPGMVSGMGSPVVIDFDANPANGLEVGVVGSNGVMAVLTAAGSILWVSKTPNADCSEAGSSNKVLGSPSAGTLFNDGVPYLVVGYGGLGGKTCGGGVVAHNGITGERRWHFNTKRFSKKKRFGVPVNHSVVSTPALGDANSDGFLEVAFGSFDRNVYHLNPRGKVTWYYNAADTVWSSAAFLNVDGKKKKEIIIGTDISANPHLNPPTQDGGHLYALKSKAPRGKKKKRTKLFPFRNSKLVKWLNATSNQTFFSTPVFGELVSSSPGPEIVIGSGCYFPEGTRNKRGRDFRVVRASDGKVLQKLSVPTCATSTAAIGDLDGDGLKEVVVVSSGLSSIGGDGFGRVIAFNPRTGEKLWTAIPEEGGRNDESLGEFMSPVIGDLDGNGSPEVVVSNGSGVSILSGLDGSQFSCDSSPCNELQRLRVSGTLQSSPAIADLNGDGQLEVIAVSGGRVYAWSYFEGKLGSPTGSEVPYVQMWPQFRGNARRTGGIE